MDELRRLGVRVPRPNRISRARDYLRRMGEEAERSGSALMDHSSATSAFRTLIEAFYIVRAADPKNPTDLSALPLLLEGTQTPDQDANPKARSTQFELFVYSLLRLGGVEGVTLAEPDIRIRAGDTFFGLAAKRLSSPGALEARVKDASHQIRRSGAPGLIVLSLDCFVVGQPQRNVTRYVRRITSDCADYIRDQQYSDSVIGIFGMATTFFAEGQDDSFRMGLHFAPSIHLLAPRKHHAHIQRKLSLIGHNVMRGIAAETAWLENALGQRE